MGLGRAYSVAMRGVDGVRSVTTVAGLAKLAAGGGNGVFDVELRRAKTPGRGEA